MKSSFVGLTSLTLPYGAGPDTPQIFLGYPPPDDLVAHYAPDTVVAALLFEQDSNDYLYIALIDPLAGRSYVDFGGKESLGLTITTSLRMRLGAGLGVSGDTGFDIVSDAYTIRGVAAGRGLIGQGVSTANSAAITTGTAIQTNGNCTFGNGRAFRMVQTATWRASVANTQPTLFFRAGAGAPGAGDVYGSVPGRPITSAAGGQLETYECVFVNTSGADVVGPAALVIQAPAGNLTQLGSVATPRTLDVFDIGLASQYPNRVSVA